MADDAIDNGKVYVLSGKKLAELEGKTKQVRGTAGHISVGTEADGCASLKYENTIRIEVIDPETDQSIILTIPYVKKETPPSPMEFAEIDGCEDGSPTTKNILVRP
jgi:hypothetical protein